MDDLFGADQIRENARPLILRDYQMESVGALRQGIRDGKKNQVLCAPTGSGKSVIAVFLLMECFRLGRRALFIVERLTLINQFSAMLDDYGVPHGVIQGDHPRCRPGAQIQVCTAQTLRSRGWPKADLIIIDEAHVIQKDSVAHVDRREFVTIGLTATPFTRGMGKHYDGVVCVTTTNKLTAEKSLVPFKIFAAVEPDMRGVRKTSFGEWEEEETGVRATRIVGDVVAEYLGKCAGEKFIAFGVTVAHAAALREQFMGAGIRCELHTYLTPDDDRERHMAEFRKTNSAIRGLISVSALSRGLDVPDVACIIMCRPLLKSLAEHIQILGRGLRPAPDKDFCTVLDAAGNTLRFWDDMSHFFEHGADDLDDGKHKVKKKPLRKEKPPVKCPRCSHVFKGGPSCPACGYEFPRKPGVEHAAGELREFIGGETSARTPLSAAAKMQLLGELKTLQLKGNFHQPYKVGWIAAKYKDMTGTWPPGYAYETLTPLPVSPETKALSDRLYRNWKKAQPKPGFAT